jgi:CDP-paratose 2-epimerase
VSVWHTPPSLSEGGACNSPPRRLADYADFISQVHAQYGGLYSSLELWNEPNNLFKWNFREFDPDWRKFASMIAPAAAAARRDGVRAVLGGIIPVDPSWLELVSGHGALDDIDVIAFHAFPHMWWSDYFNWDWHRDWQGWRQKTDLVAKASGGRALWVTETGLATWDPNLRSAAREALQVRMLEEAADAPVERLYWYSLLDLDPSREALDGFHVDESHYHMGLVAWDGSRKDSFFRMQELVSGHPRDRLTPFGCVPAVPDFARVRGNGTVRIAAGKRC